MIKLFDTHCHLQFSAFDKDRNEVMKRVLENGVGVINVGTDKKNSQEAVELAQKYDNFWAAVGQHPTENGEFDGDFFENLTKNSKVVAIGETGLDFYRITVGGEEARRQKEKQKSVFIEHIKLANRVKKPLVIHCRDAHEDLLDILNSNPPAGGQILNSPAGVMHFFTGGYEYAKQYINLGFYISFSGVITFASEYEELVKKLPLDKILIETDAPFAAPKPYRGKRNEPAYVVEVVKKIAEIKGISLEEAARQTTENAKVVFGLKM